MTRDEQIESIIRNSTVPEWMRTDKHEPVTQEEYVRSMLKAAKGLSYSVEEVELLVSGRASKGEHRSFVQFGSQLS